MDMSGGHTGRCLCGNVKYDTGSDPLWVTICYCHFCQRATGSDRYARTITDLAAAVLRFQKDDGDFHFTLDTKSGRPIAGRRMFYAAGQAALALALSGQVTGSARQLDGARAALDFRWPDGAFR